MAETQQQTEERLSLERADGIIKSLKNTYKERFGEELTDELLLAEIQVKIEESKKSVIKHMLKQLCATELEPRDLFRAVEVLTKKESPVEIPKVEIQDVKPKPRRASSSK